MDNLQKNSASLKNDFANAVRGLLMGTADIVPGVSGGTVALILGIYERLVAAISHFDLKLFRLIKGRKYSDAVKHVDLRFLITLGLGVLIGIVSLASVANYLLTHDHTRPWTLATFFGLIMASCVLVGRMIVIRNKMDLASAIVLGLIAAIFAYWLTGLLSIQMQPSLGYVFLCGMIAICAMILPGISGSFILLLMGMYVYITGVLKALKSGDFSSENILTVIVFSAGCAIGLMAFSKLLRWLLVKQEMPTMSVMCGFMIGSLRKLWPMKEETTMEHLTELGLSAEKITAIQQDPTLITQLPLNHRAFENSFPKELNSQVLLLIGTMIVAASLVLLLDKISRGSQQVMIDDGDTG